MNAAVTPAAWRHVRAGAVDGAGVVEGASAGGKAARHRRRCRVRMGSHAFELCNESAKTRILDERLHAGAGRPQLHALGEDITPSGALLRVLVRYGGVDDVMPVRELVGSEEVVDRPRGSSSIAGSTARKASSSRARCRSAPSRERRVRQPVPLKASWV